MAIFTSNKDKDSSAIDSFVKNLNAARMAPSTSGYYGNTALANALSMESTAMASLPATEVDGYATAMEGISNHLLSADLLGSDEMLGVLGIESVSEIPAHSLQAAQIMLAASGNIRGYHASQLKDYSKPGIPSMEMVDIVNGPAGRIAVAGSQSRWGDEALSLESFDEKELSNFLNYSIVYNVMASRQDEVNKLFFKPLTITPDQTGYVVEVRMERVWNGEEHNPDGTINMAAKRNLIDALVHPEVLETNGTRVIPYFQNGTIDNSAHFITEVAPYNVLLDGVPVKTAPLKVDMNHPLIGLSSHPTLISNGLMDNTDSLDSSIQIDTVYLDVNGKVVSFRTADFYRSGFVKSPEGHHREMILNFNNGGFVADADVKEHGTANQIAEFKAFSDANYDVRLRVRLQGTANVERGYVEVNALPVQIASIDKDGLQVPFDAKALASDATLKALVEALWPAAGAPKIKVIGYDVLTHRTNYNLRTRGRLIDSELYREQVLVPLLSPIAIVKPIVGGEKEYPDVKALVRATYIQANNDGIKTILNYDEKLASVVSRKSFNYDTDRDSVPGIGRFFLNPCRIHQKLHLPDLVDSVSSENRQKDIQGAVTTKINELVGRALVLTNYPDVVNTMTGGSPGKIEVIMATDRRLPQYLNIQGDVRLFGNMVDYRLASSPNKLLRNKLVMSFNRVGSSEGPDPFSYGTFIWCPELVVSIQRQLGATVTQLHMVQPRYTYVNNLPISILVEFSGIEEVTGEQTVKLISNVTAEDKSYAGNKMPAPKSTQNGMEGITPKQSKPQGSQP